MSKLKPNPEYIKNVPVKVRRRWAKALAKAHNDPSVWQAREKMLRGNQNGTGMCCLMVGHKEWGGDNKTRDADLPLRSSPFARVASSAMDAGVPSFFIAVTSSGGETHELEAYQVNDDFKLNFQQIADLVYPEGVK